VARVGVALELVLRNGPQAVDALPHVLAPEERKMRTDRGSVSTATARRRAGGGSRGRSQPGRAASRPKGEPAPGSPRHPPLPRPLARARLPHAPAPGATPRVGPSAAPAAQPAPSGRESFLSL
jgi:hypothetical protein